MTIFNDGTAKARIGKLSVSSTGRSLPVGFEYFTLNPNIPNGSLPYLGGTYSRTVYADLWSWVQEQPNYLISESEWQSLYTSNNGNVPFYSSGDGSTTFRVPSIKCYLKSGTALTDVGDYLEAGLPNITGTVSGNNRANFNTAIGSFTISSSTTRASLDTSSTSYSGFEFDASNSNSIYGNSTTVTPELINGVYCVIAYGTVTNTGNVDIQAFINQFNALNTKFEEITKSVDYQRKDLFTPNKTSITLHPLQVKVNDVIYTLQSDLTLQLSTVGTGANLAGKNVYIYACTPKVENQVAPDFVLSLNSTVPDSYTAETSRKIGGFHCLCKSVGTISGHTLSGYVIGDILPLSAWDLIHRPVSNPEAMVYIKEINKWVDIYLAGLSGTTLINEYGATTADGSSSPGYHSEKFVEEFALQYKRPLYRREFQVVAKGSNEMTSIQGSADPNTTGGHVDTAGRRMISNYGLEDCCGALWQWGADEYDCYNGNGVSWSSANFYLSGYSWQSKSVYNSAYDSQQYGSCDGLLRRVLLGGFLDHSSSCGSRCAHCAAFASYGFSDCGSRGLSEPYGSVERP